MRIQVKGRGGASADDELLSRVEKKMGKVGRQVSPLAELNIELREEPGKGDSQVAEATLRLKGVTLRACERSDDMGHSVNLLADDLARQVKKHRDKRRARREAQKHAAQEHAAGRKGARLRPSPLLPLLGDVNSGPRAPRRRVEEVQSLRAQRRANQCL